jgi:cytochrome P450
VGQHVARLEAEAVLTAMARRIRRIESAGTAVRHHNNTLRGWKSVPIRLTPA